jgi:hypothetical protein
LFFLSYSKLLRQTSFNLFEVEVSTMDEQPNGLSIVQFKDLVLLEIKSIFQEFSDFVSLCVIFLERQFDYYRKSIANLIINTS